MTPEHKSACGELVVLLASRFEAAPSSFRQFVEHETGRKMPPVREWNEEQIRWALRGLAGPMAQRFETFLATPPKQVADPMLDFSGVEMMPMEVDGD